MKEKSPHKVILVGDGRVGKTSLKGSYLGMENPERYTMTLGVEYGVKLFEENVLHIFDIGGQQIYENMMDEFFVGAHGAVLVYDVVNPKSFHRIPQWIELISSRLGYMIPAVLVGNKSDLRERYDVQVSIKEGVEMAQKLSNESIHEIPYFETSALTGMNVDHLFEHLLANLTILTS